MFVACKATGVQQYLIYWCHLGAYLQAFIGLLHDTRIPVHLGTEERKKYSISKLKKSPGVWHPGATNEYRKAAQIE